MKVIGYISVFILLTVFSSVFSGYVLSVLWAWFFVPVLSLPVIGIAEAIGIALIVQYLTHQWKDSEKKKDFAESLGEGIAIAVVKPSVALLVGWIVTFFM